MPKKQNKTGRKEKISKAIIDTIVMAIRGGNYMETAAALAGINKDTLYDWLKKADERGGLYKEFSDSIKKALAESEVRDVYLLERLQRRSGRLQHGDLKDGISRSGGARIKSI